MRINLGTRFLSKITHQYRVIFWMLIPLCLFISFVAIIIFFSHQTLMHRSSSDIRNTTSFIDDVLSDADNTAEDAIKMLGRPCIGIVDQLRVLGMKHSLVRTINLIHDNAIYCSPVALPPEALAQPYERGRTDGRSDIRFSPGTPLFPNSAVIVLRRYHGKDAVDVVVDMEYLRYIMKIVGMENDIFITIGDRFLTQRGGLKPLHQLYSGFITVKGESQRFPYQLQINISREQFIHYILETFGSIILFSVGLTLLASLMIRHWLKALTSIRFNMAMGLKRQEFEAYFQPVINAADNYCSGVEILARWSNSADGVVSPDVFIPLAEESGLIIPLTQQLMQQVAAEIARSPVRWRQKLHIAINISAVHLSNRQIVEDCRAFLAAVEGKDIQLVLELTERQFIEVNDSTLKVLASLQQLGIHIAIDDFGTGYSGLSYLSKMNIDFLKIDKSFVAMTEQESSTKIIVDVVIDLAKKLNMQVIAEGVENSHQMDYLLSKNVIYQQGYFFSRPKPLNEFGVYFIREQQRHDSYQVNHAP